MRTFAAPPARSKFQTRKLKSIQKLAFGDHESLRERTKASPAAFELLGVCADAQNSWDSIQNSHERIFADRNLSSFQQLTKSANYASQHRARLSAAFESVAARAQKRLGEIESIFDQATKPGLGAGGAQIDAEIRNFAREQFKNGKTAEITSLLSGDSADRDTVRALASAPAFLSGCSPEMHSRARAAHLRFTVPQELEEFGSIRAAAAAAETAKNSLDDWAKELIDFQSVENNRVATQESAA